MSGISLDLKVTHEEFYPFTTYLTMKSLAQMMLATSHTHPRTHISYLLVNLSYLLVNLRCAMASENTAPFYWVGGVGGVGGYLINEKRLPGDTRKLGQVGDP